MHQFGVFRSIIHVDLPCFGHGNCVCWCMAFELDIGFASQTGRKEINEDFCAAVLPQSGPEEGWGAILAIADGVSTGGMGKEAAQTTVTVWCVITTARPKPGTPLSRWTASSPRKTPGWRASTVGANPSWA
jgi:hypothetical protein